MPLLAHATLVGFDADAREIAVTERSGRRIIVNKAVTPDRPEAPVRFYLTRHPFYSSTCAPNHSKLGDYLFAGRFEVVAERMAPATTLAEALAEVGVTRIDWLKLDTQGTDLRIYARLPAGLKEGILIVDLEPGLDEWYVGEDQYIEVHRRMLEDGYWLADLEVGGSPRLRPETLETELKPRRAAHRLLYQLALKRNPTYVNARYMRRLDFFASERVGAAQLVRAWAGALAAESAGFALDLAVVHRNRFGDGVMSRRLLQEARRATRRSTWAGALRLVRQLSLRKLRWLLRGEY
jgi:hypothetical protein